MREPSQQGPDTPTDGYVDLRAHGIDGAQAAELRARLVTFAEDWESPEMDIYDNYDVVKAICLSPQ